jgi:hypothetical protein
LKKGVQMLLNAAAAGYVEAQTELGQAYEACGQFEEAAHR